MALSVLSYRFILGILWPYRFILGNRFIRGSLLAVGRHTPRAWHKILVPYSIPTFQFMFLRDIDPVFKIFINSKLPNCRFMFSGIYWAHIQDRQESIRQTPRILLYPSFSTSCNSSKKGSKKTCHTKKNYKMDYHFEKQLAWASNL